MSYRSAPDDLALHGVRTLGFATTSCIAVRYALDDAAVEEALLDFQAVGWVGRASFAGSLGWSMTDAGRVENERRLAAELERAGARETVVNAHAAFLPLNERLASACTDWQMRPTRLDPLAANDHTDWRWDERVLRPLASVGRSFEELCERLTESMARFDGYAQRYAAALRKVDTGERGRVDAPGRDSCHTVWIQFHEDLLATLGIPRGADSRS